MENQNNNPKPTSDEQPTDKGLSVQRLVRCSVWTPHPEKPRVILGSSRMAPGITLYIIELMEGRDDRGNMSGAFIPDELERDGLFSRALLNWLKWEAEGMMRDFLKSHAANACPQAAANGQPE